MINLIICFELTDHFNAAIMQSGSSFDYWALTENPNKLTQHLAHTLGCAVESSNSIIDCLKTKSVEEIVVAQHNMTVGLTKILNMYKVT